MHSPFTIDKLIQPDQLGTDPITAVLLNANRIILGNDKGNVLVFDLNQAGSGLDRAATFVSKHSIAKKPIEQLALIKELNALVCLSAGDVTLHSLPTFSLLSSFSTQTKQSASLFALTTTIHSPPYTLPRRTNPKPTAAPTSSAPPTSSPPEIHTTLAIAARRRLLIFTWIDGAWLPPAELSLPHQIRGMAFDHAPATNLRRLVAGFSTGDCGVVALPPFPNHQGKLPDGSPLPLPTLGELFSPAMPASAGASGAAGGAGLEVEKEKVAPVGSKAKAGALGGLGSVMSLSGLSTGFGGLGIGGKKVEKNGVVAVPRKKGKERAEGEASWLEGKEWGWEDEADDEGEMMVVRENVLLALSSSGQPRHPPTSDPFSASAGCITYPSAVDETLVLPPYVISLLAPPAPPAPVPGPSHAQPPPPTPTFPSLAIHSVQSLAPVQQLSLPPRPEPASLSDATAESSAELPAPITARFLTAASATSQPPVLLLTSAAPAPGTVPAATSLSADQTLWIVNMKSWLHQVEELGQQGQWEEATRLLRQVGSAGGEVLPGPMLRRLAMLHALSLYRKGKWGLAVDAFIKMEVTPAKVVGLWAESISGKLVMEEGEKEEAFGGRRYVKAEEDSGDDEEDKDDKEPAPATSAEPAPASPVKHTLAHNLLHSIHLPRSSSPSPSLRSIHPPTASDPKAFARSVDELIRYLTDRRQKYAQALAALGPTARPTPSQPRARAGAAELLELPDLPLAQLKADELARVAQVVDTALFRAYLATKAVMVGPLCRIENWCEVEEVEGLLLGKKKFRELLDLYNGKGMHDRAVKLLKQMAEDEPDDEDEKVGPTIRYLQKLGADHADLIFETSKWVFQVNPAAAIDIFVADLEEVESLPRHKTMAHLERVGRGPCVAYLEHIIHQLGEEGPEFHEKLIELYLAEVQASGGAADKAEEGGAYRKLLELLGKSTAYRADRMLGRLPSEDLYEVRAILLGRLGRHEGALQIYVYQLDDHATAEDYCARVYASTPAMRPSIFHLLLRIYLRPRASHPLLFAPALALISAHAGQMDPNEVFDLLPPLVALGDLRGWLEKSLRRSGERKREGRVVRAVGKAEVGAKAEEVGRLEGRRVRVDEGRVCPQCCKRLGNSVIAIHSPGGEVTHYQCRESWLEGKGRRA